MSLLLLRVLISKDELLQGPEQFLLSEFFGDNGA